LSLPFVLFVNERKVLLMHTELFVKRMVKIVAIRMCANWFKCFKNGDFDISDKELTLLQLWKRTNCEKNGKTGKNCEKQWKILRLIYIDFLL